MLELAKESGKIQEDTFYCFSLKIYEKKRLHVNSLQTAEAINRKRGEKRAVTLVINK